MIASPEKIKSIQLGQNNENDAPVISQENFQSSPDDFNFEDEPISPDESIISQSSPDDFSFEDKPVISQSSQDDV